MTANQPVDQARALIEIAHTLDSNADEGQRLTRTLALLKNLLGGDRCSILFDAAGTGAHKVLSVPPISGDELASLETRLLTLLRSVEDNQPLPREGPGQDLALPLVGLDQVRGMLVVERSDASFTPTDMRLVSIVAAQLGAYLTMLCLHHQARAADRLKREMSALAAHDIKNPLAAVLGMVDFLSLELTTAPEHVRTCLNDIRTACNRIHRVTANLLDLARLESHELPVRPASLDASALLATLARQRSVQAASKRASILARPSPPGPHVLADEDLLARVVDNLLDNAVRYVPAQGRIELEARQTGDRVQVRVGNDGPPVPVSVQDTLFEKFVQATQAGRMNLGLGLYFARMAMEAQQGSIWLERSDTLPVVFCLELPAAAAPVAIS